MSTNLFDAKAAVIDRLKLLAGQSGHLLEGVQAVDAYPGKFAERECVYGGFADFEQSEDDDLTDGRETISVEDVLLRLHLQVQKPLTDQQAPAAEGEVVVAMLIRSCEARLSELVTGIRQALNADNALPGTLMLKRIQRGNYDYWITDDAVGSRLVCHLAISGFTPNRSI